MLKSKKKSCIADLEDIYRTSSSVIFTHYHGLTVEEITKLRRSLGKEGVSFKVVKNTLASIAAKNVGVLHDQSMYAGPTAIAYSIDSLAPAKGVVEFSKTNSHLKVIGGLVDQVMLDASEVQRVAKLPSLSELRSKILGLLQDPAMGLVRVIQTPASSITRVLKAYSEK